MKKILLCFFSLLLTLSATAQQAQELKRTDRVVAYPEFRNAKILQTFGRHIMGDVNIFMKDASLLFKDKDGVIRQASNASIIGVQFDDTTKYIRVDNTAMGRVLAEQGYNALICVTTIDAKKMEDESMKFAEIDFGKISMLLEINKENDGKLGYPLKDTFYFSVRGRIVKANETDIKKEIRPELKKEFKEVMDDRWWSWKDAENLKDILKFLP